MAELGDKVTTKPVAQSGQYLLADWQLTKTVLKRNFGWVHEQGGFEEIHIIPIEDPATERGFEAGDRITRLQFPPPPRLKKIRRQTV